MPITLNELLEQGAKDGLSFSDDAVRDAAVEALKKHANPVYMAINNLAFGAAQARMKQEVTDAKAAQQAAEDRAKKAEDDLKTFVDKTPDTKTLNAQCKAKERQLLETHKSEVEKLTTRIRNSLLARDQAELENRLVELKVPRAMAKVLARDPNLLPARADYDDNGALSVHQAGQQIPFVPGSGQTHLGLLAEEVAATVDADLLVSDGDSGSGVTGGGTPGKGDTAFFDNIHQQARKEQTAEVPSKPLRERIANR